MKPKGPRNRGSHPDGLPLTSSGLYISCAYLLVMLPQFSRSVKVFSVGQPANKPPLPTAERDLLAIIKEEGRV